MWATKENKKERNKVYDLILLPNTFLTISRSALKKSPLRRVTPLVPTNVPFSFSYFWPYVPSFKPQRFGKIFFSVPLLIYHSFICKFQPYLYSSLLDKGLKKKKNHSTIRKKKKTKQKKKKARVTISSKQEKADQSRQNCKLFFFLYLFCFCFDLGSTQAAYSNPSSTLHAPSRPAPHPEASSLLFFTGTTWLA